MRTPTQRLAAARKAFKAYEQAHVLGAELMRDARYQYTEQRRAALDEAHTVFRHLLRECEHEALIIAEAADAS